MQNEYYVLERAASNLHPLLGWDQSGSAFYRGRSVTVDEPIRLRLGKPAPPKPVMVDHHSLPKPVVSTRLRDVLDPLQLHRVQFVPADVRVTEDDVRRYWLMHVFNEISCIDRKHSILSIDDEDGEVLFIDRLVLDERMLTEIPQDQRLVFVLAESTSMHLVHRSVVDRLMALTPQPEGLRFIPVDQWDDATAFQA